MKRIIFIAAVVVLSAIMLLMCGCSSCSREMMYASEGNMPEKLPEYEPPYIENEPSSEPDKAAFDIEEDVAIEEPEELPPLAMEADFEAIAQLSNEAVLWGPGVHKDDKGRSTACIDLQEKYGEYDAFFIGSEDNDVITLSFDQGYENGYTAPILDALKEKDVKAIFFLTGHYVRTQPELVQRMIDEGHILGSHSNEHKVYCSDISIEESFEDAKWMQGYLRENFDYEMRLFRFPEGEFSEQSLSLIQQLGYKSVFWSFA